jgi:1-acyl-sn-glycerol-3-phosphate acyltransferase
VTRRPPIQIVPDRAQSKPNETSREAADLPHISPMLRRLFGWYARRFVRRHFHTVRISGDFAVQEDLPVVVYCNHPSWWDLMMVILLAEQLMPRRSHYAPVDSDALEKYKMFKRLGFYGIDQNHRRGARDFLRISEAILDSPRSALWITPQGRFADVRERPLGFERGLGKLATRCKAAVFVPVAMEYTFWEERLPETLIWVGQPTLVEGAHAMDDRALSCLFEHNLGEAQDHLAAAAVRRDVQPFKTILQGKGGVSGIYDGWRSLIAKIRGEAFSSNHGTL